MSNRKTIYLCVNMYIYMCICRHTYMKIYFVYLHIYIYIYMWNIWESSKEYSPCCSSQCEWDPSEEKLKHAWAFFICCQFPCAPLAVSISPRGCDSSACYVFFKNSTWSLNPSQLPQLLFNQRSRNQGWFWLQAVRKKILRCHNEDRDYLTESLF